MKKLALAAMLIAGCTDTTVSSIEAYGSAGRVVCYSGGQVIFDGHSTGVIHTVQQSDGWEFRDAKTRKLVRVSGDCLIEY